MGSFHGRLYLNMSAFMAILAQVPGLSPRLIFALGGGEGLPALEAEANARGELAYLARLPMTVRRFAKENLQVGERVARFEDEFASERRRLEAVDLAVLSPSGLARTLTDIERLLDRTGAVMLTVYGNLLGCAAALTLAMRAVAGDEAERLVRDLLLGLSLAPSAEAGLALMRVAEVAARDPGASDVLLRGPLPERVDDLPPGPTRDALSHLLRVHGHRGAREAELAEPRWGESPGLIFSTLRAQLRAPTPPSAWAVESRRRDRRRAATDELARRIPLPLRLPLRELIRLTQHFVAQREALRDLVVVVLGFFRQVGLEVSSRIRALEPDAADGAAFFLTVDEVHAYLAGRLPRVALRVRQRRAAHARDRALPEPPPSFVGFPPAEVEAPSDEETLRGLASSGGVAEGTVCVLRSAEDAERVEVGDILVVSSADVGLSPLFLAAGAVVTELGGPLSHAAIILREYGTPAVMNVRGATRALREGERVRVDGDRGVLERLDARGVAEPSGTRA